MRNLRAVIQPEEFMLMIVKAPVKDCGKTDPVRQWMETSQGRIYCGRCFEVKYGFVPG